MLCKFFKIFGIIALISFSISCESVSDEEEKAKVVVPQPPKIIQNYNAQIEVPSYPKIRTTDGASSFDLEIPLRCFVNWDTQQMISTIPYNITAFNFVRNGNNDMLPRFEVNGLSSFILIMIQIKRLELAEKLILVFMFRNPARFYWLS